MRIGLVVNPVAGLGGRVGLKGTDGVVEEARRRGATPRAPGRALRFVGALRGSHEWVTAGGAMGEAEFVEAGVQPEVAYTPRGPETTGKDTETAARALADAGVDVVAFVGGDGTAADVARGLGGRETPALGVPAGVKMYSAVFADTPEAAARILESGWDATREREVLDIDETAYRDGRLNVALKGILRVPAHSAVAGAKLAQGDDQVEQATLAEAVRDLLEAGEVVAVGAGSTLRLVKAALGAQGTLLGVDVLRVKAPGEAEVLKADAAEADLLALPRLDRVIVSPIGHQGFIFGRGNPQISPEVLRRVGPDRIAVAATPTKLLETPVLRVDTGDVDLDRAFPGFMRVVTGHGQTKLARVQKA